MTRVMNFNPGPAALPLPALERAREELLDFESTGMSVMEHSHRGKEYEAVHNETVSLLRDLAGIPTSYDVLLLQGGASQQFAQVPMNLLDAGATAAYVLTGAWGEKAYQEAGVVAKLLGAQVSLAATTAQGEGKTKTYARVPAVDELRVDAGARYLHLTSNETIHGVQFAADPGSTFPDAGRVPVVCDMSSDFLWRPFDVRTFGLIYAGAQKNIGPSGVVVVIVRKDLVEQARRDIPVIFQYRTASDSNSLYNTPPTFGVYLVRNVLAWCKEQGGLAQMEAWNREKARLIYASIDAHPDLYRCPVEPGSRSRMNIVFRVGNAEQEERFLSEAEKNGMVGLRGHRSVGGVRASLYNAVPVAWAQALSQLMEDFARRLA